MLILLGKVAQLRAGGTSLIALTNLSLPPLEEAWSARVQLLDKSAKSGTNKLFDWDLRWSDPFIGFITGFRNYVLIINLWNWKHNRIDDCNWVNEIFPAIRSDRQYGVIVCDAADHVRNFKYSAAIIVSLACGDYFMLLQFVNLRYLLDGRIISSISIIENWVYLFFYAICFEFSNTLRLGITISVPQSLGIF